MSGFTSISGIFSGINTTELIDSIIEYERQPAALMEVDQTEKTNIVTTLKALQAKVYALQAQTQKLTYAATYRKSSISVSDETYLTASDGGGNIASGTYDIQILSVARNHQLASQGFEDAEQESFGIGTLTLGVGTASAQTITIDATNNSLIGIKDAINDADAGVTATIISDGSASNSYRLILTAQNTGAANRINLTSDLSGGANLNFATASFDVPETILMDSGSSAGISLGATAAFTGNENKIYTFTVRGEGEQTIGSDNITVDWTDGSNSGSILITQADFEYELVGEGADGLKLAFSSGALHAGDTFQVQSFSPRLQEASDAKISFGAADGSGSPIVVTNSTNKFSDVVPGVSLEVKQVTAPGDSVSVSTDIDVSAIEESISTFINAFNELQKYIDDQNSYDPETEEGGILLGDSIIQTIQYSIRGVLSSKISNDSDTYNYLSSIGIRTNADGQLSIKDSARLEEAIRENLDEVIDLFTDTGRTSSEGIEFVSAGTDTKEGREFDVVITQAATRGTFTGVSISDPGSTALILDETNNRLKLTVDGVISNEIVLTAKNYDSVDELVREIQTRIDSDLKIGSTGVTVAWEESDGGGGNLVFTSSKYGSVSKISVDRTIDNNAATILGLGAGIAINGRDVKGTIDGEEATGSGQFLTGNNTNKTTAGLKVKVTLTEEQLTDSTAGTVTLTKGLASKMNTLLTSLTLSGEGLLDRRISSYQTQIDSLAKQITDFDARLEIRREYLEAKYMAMEEALAALDSTASYLESQIAGLSKNWKSSTGS